MIDFKKELNTSQYEACVHTGGPQLILAGAGSGKTRVLTYKIAYMIGTENIPANQILAITFTNKAAEEMLSRSKKLLEDRSKNIMPTICTFHSLGYKILCQTYSLLGYKKRIHICDDKDSEKRLNIIAKAMDIKKHNTSMIIEYIRIAKDHLMTPLDCQDFKSATSVFGSGFNGPLWSDFCRVYKEYQDGLFLDNLVDFDDLIMLPVKLFQQDPQILRNYQEKYRYILVDEYQDTSRAQFVLISLLAGRYRNLCVVGDDYQSIYKFRGADISNILSFQKNYPDAKVTILGENYRSTQVIVDTASNVISNNRYQFHKNLSSMREKGDLIRINEFSYDTEEAAFIADTIKKYHDEGEPYSSFAILYRQNNMSVALEKALFKLRIPAIVYGSIGFYQRAEIKDILSYLSVIVDSGDSIALQRIINLPARGIGKATLKKAESFASSNHMSFYDAVMTKNTGNKKVESFKDMILSMRTYIKDNQLSLMAAVRHILDTIKYSDYLKKLDDPDDDEHTVFEDKSNNIRNLLTQCHDYDTDNPDLLFGEKVNLFLENAALMTDQDRVKESGAVSLMSIHRSKGLEYKYVFLTGCEEEVFPGDEECGVPYDMEYAIDENPILEEERRLCYVAMTRAKDRLFISSCNRRFVYGEFDDRTPSRFVSEIMSGGEYEYSDYSHSGDRVASSNWRAPIIQSRNRSIAGPVNNPGHCLDTNIAQTTGHYLPMHKEQ